MANNIGYDIGNNKWFLGQVPPCHNQHKEGILWEDAHGDRVKVRIPGMHPMSSNDDATEVLDSELPWAIVAKPTTNGYRNYQSSAIWGGEWVIGFFIDEDCQIPVITQVLGVNIKGGIKEAPNGTTLGQLVNRYTCGNHANNSQIAIPIDPNKLQKPPSNLLSISDVDAANPLPPVDKATSDGLDNLTAAEAQELARTELDPTKTGASNREVLEAAKTARETARAAGKSQEEVERSANIASVRALRSQNND